jgi:uncharacterized membrane protein
MDAAVQGDLRRPIERAIDAPMTTTDHASRRRAPKAIRIVRARPRLFVSLAIGIAAAVILHFVTTWQPAFTLLVSWDISVALYLAFAFYLMASANVHHMRSQARLQDEGQFMILVLVGVAALASMAAIFALLSTSHGKERYASDIILATVTILLSWAFTHTMFALHYAHEFHDEGKGGGGMQFPGDTPEPDYWDFMYFSFVVGMCAQVSDVTVSSHTIRRTVLAHSIISFIFNAALLALTVNIAASAI